jgi:hypothetical protein
MKRSQDAIESKTAMTSDQNDFQCDLQSLKKQKSGDALQPVLGEDSRDEANRERPDDTTTAKATMQLDPILEMYLDHTTADSSKEPATALDSRESQQQREAGNLAGLSDLTITPRAKATTLGEPETDSSPISRPASPLSAVSIEELLVLFFAEVAQHWRYFLPRDVLSYLTQILFFPPLAPPPCTTFDLCDEVNQLSEFGVSWSDFSEFGLQFDLERENVSQIPTRKEREKRRADYEELIQRKAKPVMSQSPDYHTHVQRVDQFTRWKQRRDQRWQEEEVAIKLWERRRDRVAALVSRVVRLLGSLTRDLRAKSKQLLEMLYSASTEKPGSALSNTPNSHQTSDLNKNNNCNNNNNNTPSSIEVNTTPRPNLLSSNSRQRLFCDAEIERLHVPGWQIIYIRRRCDGDGLEENAEGTDERAVVTDHGTASESAGESQLSRRYHHTDEREDCLLTKPTHLPHVTLPKKSAYPWIEGFDKTVANTLGGTWGKGMFLAIWSFSLTSRNDCFRHNNSRRNCMFHIHVSCFTDSLAGIEC